MGARDIKAGMRERHDLERELETGLILIDSHVVGFDWIIIIVPSGPEEGTSMNPRIGDGVIEDLENGVGIVGVKRASEVEVAR